jgi:hypothetical protein
LRFTTEFRFLYYTENSREYIIINSFEHHHIINYSRRFTPIIATLPTTTKIENEEILTLSKLEEPKMDVIASQANPGQ